MSDPLPPRPPDGAGPAGAGATPLTWSQVLDEEDRALRGADAPADSAEPLPDDEAARLRQVVARLHRRGRSALCLSGGGVRSGTFALGILQGLASLKILDRFDYLSTVSGGGYIGGWLTAWVRREGMPSVLASLDPERAGTTLRATESPVERVRDTCRFLAPQGGLFSADVWTLLATAGRNLILNWMVLLPLMAAALLVPHAYYAVIKMVEISTVPEGTAACFSRDQPAVWLLAITVITLTIQNGYIAMNFAGRGKTWSQRSFLLFMLIPSVAGAAAFTVFWSSFPCLPTLSSFLFLGSVIPATGWLVVSVLAHPSVRGALLAALACAASVYAWTVLPADFASVESRAATLRVALSIGILLVALGIVSRHLGQKHSDRPKSRRAGLFDGGRRIPASLVAGLVLGGGMYVLVVRYFPFTSPFTDGYAVFAVPAILLIWALSTVLFIGLASADFSDGALEWWSRCGAWVGIAAVAWLAAFLFDFHLAHAVEFVIRLAKASVNRPQVPIELVAIVLIPLLSSLAGLAARAAPPGRRQSPIRAFLQTAGLPLVIVVLVSSIAWATNRALGLYDGTRLWGELELDSQSAAALLRRIFLLGGILVIAGLVMSRFVPVNRFSLHGMYRQRLMRTFLGASNPAREPNVFTGFDPRDDMRMHELAHVRPLHIVNVTLNAVSATQVGRNDRSAQAFTFSPLHAGSRLPDMGYRPTACYESDTASGPPGLSLGLAVAVSGAAASSAMGFYSSKARAFLLTLANARLGLWFGNPAKESTWRLTEPPLGVGPLLHEMLGLSTASNPYVYLSDGGHFENLGLYEMVARRCHLIVVSDAGCDPDYTYDSLGHALRRIRLDFGIPIDFDEPLVACRDGQGKGNPYAAVATIRYSIADGPTAPDGTLVYIKATLSGTEPVDVWNFAKSNPAFPHDPTSDQFFDEARFESYRSLGYYTMRTLAGARFRGEGGVLGFCEAVRATLAACAGASTPPKAAPIPTRSGAGKSEWSST